MYGCNFAYLSRVELAVKRVLGAHVVFIAPVEAYVVQQVHPVQTQSFERHLLVVLEMRCSQIACEYLTYSELYFCITNFIELHC